MSRIKIYDLYGECMDGRLKKHKEESLLFLGINPKKYDELSWAGLCKSMAEAFNEGSGSLYDFFKKNLEVAFDTHEVERSTWTIHNQCGAYDEEDELFELMMQLEDVIVVYGFIHNKWPKTTFRVVQQTLLDSEGERVTLRIMSIEQVREQLAQIKMALSRKQKEECTG